MSNEKLIIEATVYRTGSRVEPRRTVLVTRVATAGVLRGHFRR